MTSVLSHLRDRFQRTAARGHNARFARAAHQAHGVVSQDTGPVVLVTQWRQGDLDAFFAHYRALGLCYFVFYGAGAPDNALARIKQEPGTVIVQNGLRVPVSEDTALHYLSENYGKDRWCLTVSSGQLLDFESSAGLGLAGLISYLETIDATAVVAHQLDMFPKGALGQITNMDLAQKVLTCTYFDISKLVKIAYHDPAQPEAAALALNTAVQDDLVLYQQQAGGSSSTHPLVYNGSDVELRAAPNHPTGVRCADVTAVLKCYTNAALTGETGPEAQLFSLAARRWNRAALLVRAGLLSSSDQYGAWVREHSK